MTEWKEYTGSDEQIAEILQADLFIVDSKLSTFKDPTKLKMPVTETYVIWLRELMSSGEVKQYLICQPRPLADMICQQARSGQPVWVKEGAKCMHPFIYETDKPDWNIPGAEYSFTAFEEE